MQVYEAESKLMSAFSFV